MADTMNRDGEWVTAIPEPFYSFRKICCYEGFNNSGCGAKFWTLEGYRAHYALKHILKLD